MTAGGLQYEAELADQIAEFYADPLAFTLFVYPWGERGPLKDFKGPNRDQERFLGDLGDGIRNRRFDGRHPVEPIRMSISSGHGIGKSALIAFIAGWLMSTRPGCRGTVTATTSDQLRTKTWAAIQRWTRLSVNKHWFEITSERFWYLGEKDDWFCAPLTCREENTDAFQGQHAITSTSFYLFDEASGVSDKIWDAAEGGLTDGEPIFVALGNCLRRSGKFFEVNFGRDRKYWNSRVLSAEDSEFSNKAQIERWREQKGEDSDFFRVRVKGLAPRSDDLQYIDTERVLGAQKRLVRSIPSDPLLCGVDVARGGMDDNCIRFRKGFDARSLPPIRIIGEATRDSAVLWTKLSTLLSEGILGRRIDVMFVDGTGIGGPIVNRLRELGHKNVIEVQFAGHSPDPHCANMRAHMWSKMKDWLLNGAIDDDARIETDLTGPGVHFDNKDHMVLESKEDMKERGLDSPDDGDALALTFAHPVAPRSTESPYGNLPRVTAHT